MAIEYRAQQSPLVQPCQIEHHIHDMTVMAAADVQLKILQGKLAENRQWLPIDGQNDLPIGQLVQKNSTGPLRLGYGAWRDLLLGCQFRGGDGQLVTTGGRTMKNVAGYDLTKFMVGQYGVFGEPITITARTFRRPDGALLARFSPQIQTLNRLLPTSERPQWAILTADALYCGYLGDRRTLDYWRSALGANSFQPSPLEIVEHSVQEDIDHRADLFNGRAADGFRASVPPNGILEFVERCRPTNWAADAAFGIVVGSAGASEAEQAASACGGVVCGSAANGSELLRRLKKALDPSGKLQPLA